MFEDGELLANATYSGVLTPEDAASIADVPYVHFGPEAPGQPPRTTREPHMVELAPRSRHSRIFSSTPHMLSDSAVRVLSPLILFVDCDFLWVQRETSGTMFVGQPLAVLLQVFRSSMARELQVYLSAVATPSQRPVRWMWTRSPGDEQDVAAARYDLQGALIRATTVVSRRSTTPSSCRRLDSIL